MRLQDHLFGQKEGSKWNQNTKNLWFDTLHTYVHWFNILTYKDHWYFEDNCVQDHLCSERELRMEWNHLKTYVWYLTCLIFIDFMFKPPEVTTSRIIWGQKGYQNFIETPKKSMIWNQTSNMTHDPCAISTHDLCGSKKHEKMSD